ncbi:MAG: hypothetical protein U0Y10_16110 [Spirosomataceae bacterium]
MKHYSLLFFLLFNSVVWAQTTDSTAKQVTIRLTQGNTLIGKLVRETAELLELESPQLGKIIIAREQIQSIEYNKTTGKSIVPMAPYRYLFNPAAYNVPEGKWYYTNAYFSFNSFTYGLTNSVSIQLGTEAISTLTGHFTFMGALKATGRISEMIGVGLNINYLRISDLTGLGYFHGYTTIGKPDANFTIGAGYGLAGGEWSNSPLISFSGMKRISNKIALVTDNFFLPNLDDQFNGFISYGIKILGKRMNADVGFLNNKSIFESFPVGFPYASVFVKMGKMP